MCANLRPVYLFAAALTFLMGSFANAVTFNLVYRGPGSASPDPRATTNPNDPTGALLAAHMQHAAPIGPTSLKSVSR